jgi:hypothetical protein
VLSLSGTAYRLFSIRLCIFCCDVRIFRWGWKKFQLGIFRCLRLVGLRLVRNRICYGRCSSILVKSTVVSVLVLICNFPRCSIARTNKGFGAAGRSAYSSNLVGFKQYGRIGWLGLLMNLMAVIVVFSRVEWFAFFEKFKNPVVLKNAYEYHNQLFFYNFFKFWDLRLARRPWRLNTFIVE